MNRKLVPYVVAFALLGVFLLVALVNPTLTIRYSIESEKHPTYLQMPIELNQVGFMATVYVLGVLLFFRFWKLLVYIDEENDIGKAGKPVIIGIVIAYILAFFVGAEQGLPDSVIEGLARLGVASIAVIMGFFHFVISL